MVRTGDGLQFKLRHEKLGGHVHVGVFLKTNAPNYAKAGDLCFREEEWIYLSAVLSPFVFLECLDPDLNEAGTEDKTDIEEQDLISLLIE
jgi:hypothetical protein